MRANQKKLINGLLVLVCILSAQMAGPQQLLAANNMSLTASPTSVPADGFTPSLITATVDNSGVPEQGVGLRFTTSLGRFSSGGQTIDTFSNGTGISVVALTSPNTGTATVTCITTTGPVISRTVFVNFSVVPQPTPTPQPTPSPFLTSFVLSADPPAVPAYDPSLTVATYQFSSISAQIYDQNGKPLALPDVSVVFTTTPAGLAHFSNKLTTITVSTDGSGKATALLYSPVVGTATVSAVINNGFNKITTNPVFVNFTGPGQAASIVLSANPTSIPADSTSFSTITATLYDGNAKPVISGVSVSFTTSIGYFANLQKTISVNTNDVGVASVYVHSGSTVGTANISATSNGVSSNVFVSFTGSGPTAGIVLSADPATIPADSLSFITITATLYDTNGQTVISGVAVNFTTPIGNFANNLKVITLYTNSKGVASVIIYSGGVIGTAQVSASSNGITRYIDVGFTGSGPTADIVLSANPATIPSDQTSYSTITATLYDTNGQKVSSGVSVDFSTTLGFFSNIQKTVSAFTNTNGVATAYIYSGAFVGLAKVGASSNGVTRYVNISFIGVGPPAFISLTAAPNWIPADGYTYTTITATILDSAGKPVAAGTTVSFSTTLGVFGNGKSSYLTVTPDDKGTLTVHLRATSTVTTGTAVITSTSGAASQALAVGIVRLEYETEPNNDMAHADGICFNTVFLSNLFNPYEEDWYKFIITEPSRIGINFITTAIPKIAGDCKTSTTVGTYRVDIRDENNNVLTSYQNVDCSLDNGIWETGVMLPGTYYVVVYCPRLPDNSHYLNSAYYLAVFDNFYLPCGDRDKQVNSAALSLAASAYRLYVPIVEMNPYLWADLQYDPVQGTSLMFRLINYGTLANLNDYRACNLSILSQVDGNYVLHVPVLIFDGVSYRVDLTYVPTMDGQIWFMLSGVWLN